MRYLFVFALLALTNSACVQRALDVPLAVSTTLPIDSCAKLDEVECIKTPNCLPNYCECDFCNHLPFAGCHSSSAPSVTYSMAECPLCPGSTETACIDKSACAPHYCPDCHGGHFFSDCVEATDELAECPAFCPKD